jgi:hypothetical protein
MIIYAIIAKHDDSPWPPTKEKKDSIAIQIKEVPVNVYVHDTVRIKIPCTKQHYETRIDTAQ